MEILKKLDKLGKVVHIKSMNQENFSIRTIKGLYDGEKFIPLENFPQQKKYKVIITFLEEIDEDEEIRNFTAQTDAFSFWEDPREDLYQDYLGQTG